MEGKFKIDIILVVLLLIGTAWGQENGDDLTYSADSAFRTIITDPVFTISVTDDGQIQLNGKAIERMSDPEIKETMLELRKYLLQQQRDRSLVRQYEHQTEYLLREIERCQNSK